MIKQPEYHNTNKPRRAAVVAAIENSQRGRETVIVGDREYIMSVLRKLLKKGFFLRYSYYPSKRRHTLTDGHGANVYLTTDPSAACIYGTHVIFNKIVPTHIHASICTHAYRVTSYNYNAG